MDKMLDLILKNVPAAVIPGILAAVAIYFGVFYFKGYRNYTDALHDRFFLSGLVVVAGFFILTQIYKDRDSKVLAESVAPLLMVPEFDDDERGQFRALFVQYLDSALSAADKGARRVATLDNFVTDADGARLTGQKHRANAVIYSPRVIRIKDKTLVCFNVLVMNGGLTKAYPPVSIEIDKVTLDDLAQILLSNQNVNAGAPNPIIARLDALEKQLADLRSAVFKSNESRDVSTPVVYKTKRALLVGIDTHLNAKFPSLRFAVSDAKRTASALAHRGFQTTVLANVNREAIEQGIQDLVNKSEPDDLLVIYMAGMTTRSTDLGFAGTPILVLPASDLSTENMSGNLDLAQLIGMLDKAKARHKLVILDGCNGTTGLEVKALPARSSPSPDEAFQILAGSQDDQYGMESLEAGGGVLTSAFVDSLRKTTDPGELSIQRAFGELSTAVEAMARRLGSGQTPKLVNVRGSGKIFL